MRTEKEMLALIMNTASEDARVRAVILNGSRANPNARRDIFQDFDVVYLVTDVTPFRHNLSWIKRFGELMIMQMPDEMPGSLPADGSRFTYLMQFADGNRIDLTVFPIARLDELGQDSLSLLLLDKDGRIGPLAPPDESTYLPTPPTARQYADCCNEFWWVCPYVAKGLWREEIIYAKTTFDNYVRKQFMKMVTWYIGIKTQFLVNPGKHGKYFERYLDPALWTMLLNTYSDAGYDGTWDALLAACDLFRVVAVPVAEYFGFDYLQGDDDRVSAYLRHIRSLPSDAKAIY
jgi:aminoglycoside 6-adenylyltransferase